MSRSRKILKLVQPHLPGTVLCRDVLVIAPTDYVLRGFFLNSTSEKHHMELWTIVMPLHQPRQGIVLTYGSIVAGPDHTRVRVDDLPRAAEVVRNCLRDQVEPLRCIQSAAHFLRHIARLSGNNAEVVQLDSALTHFLLGNIGQAFGILRSLDARPEMFPDHRRTVRQALDALETGPDELSHLIDRWRDANVANLALERSVRRQSSLRLISSQ